MLITSLPLVLLFLCPHIGVFLLPSLPLRFVQLNVAPWLSMKKINGETETTAEKDGLVTATVVRILVGDLLAIGLIGGVILLD